MSRYIFTNGNILTMDDAVPFAEAVAVDGGLIAGAGSLADMKSAMPDAQIRDLQGTPCFPASSTATVTFPPAA